MFSLSTFSGKFLTNDIEFKEVDSTLDCISSNDSDNGTFTVNNASGW